MSKLFKRREQIPDRDQQNYQRPATKSKQAQKRTECGVWDTQNQPALAQQMPQLVHGSLHGTTDIEPVQVHALHIKMPRPLT